MSSANGTINSTIKKFAFQRSIKTIKNKIKIKSEFSFNHKETIKRITNDIGIKKTSSGKIPTYFFRKYDFVFNTVTVCVKEILKTGSFHYSQKCSIVRPICKK